MFSPVSSPLGILKVGHEAPPSWVCSVCIFLSVFFGNSFIIVMCIRKASEFPKLLLDPLI